ncbi:hypothetical protein CWB99_13240 [Pseudoalteromonas rubra]|uniref:Uncharacterized protein n=2 Tax=Pseudoalteromonas rubra TaxID=43658 RepID=A0A5S3WLF1_9GAMM|nr:hypothetical protein CWB99_13240 [Pseudoalteromonas rubra]TMP31160.1 hypothetical protein CWC00_15050 [Pseudoalteromonas rubra]
MAKRMKKLTPVASTIALSLGLTGCSLFDSDDNKPIVNPPPAPSEVESTVNAKFNVSVSGKAVKGTLSGAMVSVKTVDAQGNMVDLAYRTAAGEESATETAESESEAKEKAEAKLISGNPAELKTSAQGLYEIFVDEGFSGPLYITVKTTKDGDALVKCDAFAGCGVGTAVKVNDGSVFNDNGKVDFGEWYKDDIELSVVKLISANTAARAASAKNAPSYADGDDGSYKANLSIFTSTAARILLAGESAIDSAAVGQASIQVIGQLVGDLSLVATLASDLSLGGVVDFTDVDGTEKLDAGALVLVQVASSLQSLAGKESRTVADVLAELSGDVEQGNLGDSQIFSKLKTETQKAGKVLNAIVSGDDEAIRTALIEAGVDETDVAQVAADAKAAKDKAVKNGATSDDQLKDDSGKVVDQLDDLGNGDTSLDSLDASLLASIEAGKQTLTGSDAQLDEFAASLAAVKALAADTATKEKAIAYGSAAVVLNTQFTAATATDVEGDNLGKLLARELSGAEQLVSAAAGLVTLDAKYQPTLTQAGELLTQVTTLVARKDQLSGQITAELAAANAKIAEFGATLDVAKQASDEGLLAAKESKEVAIAKKGEMEVQLQTAIAAVAAITDQATAEAALSELVKTQTSLQDAIAAYQAAEIAAKASLELANTYKTLAQNQNASTDEADLAINESNELISEALLEISVLQGDTAQQIEDYRMTALAMQGTEKMVDISFVTKEGADATFNAGEIIYDVVKDIWDSGLDSGDHSGTAPNFPDWKYSYNTNTYALNLENTKGDEKIAANGQVNSGAESKIIFTWSGFLMADSGQKVEIKSPDLAECERWAIDAIAMPNASCSVLYVDGSIQNVEDARDFDISRGKTFNLIEFVDGQYGFNGYFHSELTAVDQQGNPSPLFVDDTTELASIVLKGDSEGTGFTAHFDIRNEDNNDDLGVAEVSIDNFNGYVFRVGLIDQDGPLLGSVSLFNDTDQPVDVGTVEEITNGFRIDYLTGLSIDYTDIDFIGQPNN